MKIGIAGGTGLIGSAVKRLAEQAGHTVTVFKVPRPETREAHQPEAWTRKLAEWKPETFMGYEALMFLGGESISSRWTERKKKRIELSRQMPCARIAECVAQLPQKPSVIVTASAVGFYGDRGEENVTEKSNVGKGYLAQTTAEWEKSWKPAEMEGIRVVLLRFGVVLNPDGGALKMMLPAFRLGLGGPLGTGKQWMSWITREDAARMALWAVENPDVHGPLNGVAPEPVRQEHFARALGNALNRPAFLPVPQMALTLGFGEMAKETILCSCRIYPEKAGEAGFHFHQPEIQKALLDIVES